jgi:hypothetical protein
MSSDSSPGSGAARARDSGWWVLEWEDPRGAPAWAWAASAVQLSDASCHLRCNGRAERPAVPPADAVGGMPEQE